MNKWISVLAILCLGALSAFAGTASGGGSEVRFRAKLTGNAIGSLVPSGHAVFRERAGRFTRFGAEVEDVNLSADTELDVFFGTSVCSGTLVGTIILGPAPIRGGDLNLDTRDRETVPQMQTGDLVSVCLNGTPVVSGILKKK